MIRYKKEDPKSTGHIADFLARNNIVSREKTQFLKDIFGNTDEITENSFSDSQKDLLIDAVANATKAGRKYVTYSDYGGGLSGVYHEKDSKDNTSNNVFFTDDATVLKRVLGKFSFTEDAQGIIKITDQYNFNEKKDDPTSLSELYDDVTDSTSSAFGRIRSIGEYMGSNEGEGSKVSINLNRADRSAKVIKEDTPSIKESKKAIIPTSNTFSNIISEKSDPYMYKRDPNTNEYFTKKKNSNNWIKLEKETGAYIAVKNKFPEIIEPTELKKFKFGKRGGLIY